MNWKQSLILLTAILFNVLAFCSLARCTERAGNAAAPCADMVLAVAGDGTDAAGEQGSFGLPNGCSCAYSVLNIKDFHKFFNFRPAEDAVVACEYRTCAAFAESTLQSGGTLSRLRRLNL